MCWYQKKIKKYYFNVFSSKKHFENQLSSRYQTGIKRKSALCRRAIVFWKKQEELDTRVINLTISNKIDKFNNQI